MTKTMALMCRRSSSNSLIRSAQRDDGVRSVKQYEFGIAGGTVTVRCSDRSDGSFALDEPAGLLGERRLRLLGEGRQWVGLRQVHGAAVFDPSVAPVINSEPSLMPQADASFTFDSDLGLSILTADCAPVVLIGSNGVAAAHAGWRGAAAGVIEEAAERLRAGGSEPVATMLGPCIQPGAYEFGAEDLEPIVASFGPEVVGRTESGTDALDLTRVVQISCERAGWPVPERPACTSGAGYYSHRTRADKERQATVAWIEWAA